MAEIQLVGKTRKNWPAKMVHIHIVPNRLNVLNIGTRKFNTRYVI